MIHKSVVAGVVVVVTSALVVVLAPTLEVLALTFPISALVVVELVELLLRPAELVESLVRRVEWRARLVAHVLVLERRLVAELLVDARISIKIRLDERVARFEPALILSSAESLLITALIPASVLRRLPGVHVPALNRIVELVVVVELLEAIGERFLVILLVKLVERLVLVVALERVAGVVVELAVGRLRCAHPALAEVLHARHQARLVELVVVLRLVLIGPAVALVGADVALSTLRGLGDVVELLAGGLARLVHDGEQLACLSRVPRREEREGGAGLFAASRSADAMDVILRCVRVVVVDDVLHILDVETACGNVGGDQDVGAAVAEALQHVIALVLALIAVNRVRLVTFALDDLQDVLDLLLGLHEDDALVAGVGCERLQQSHQLRLLL